MKGQVREVESFRNRISNSTIGRNNMKSTHSIHRQKRLSDPMSSGVSGASERSSERRNEWLSTVRVDLIGFLPNVELYDVDERVRPLM